MAAVAEWLARGPATLAPKIIVPFSSVTLVGDVPAMMGTAWVMMGILDDVNKFWSYVGRALEYGRMERGLIFPFPKFANL